MKHKSWNLPSNQNQANETDVKLTIDESKPLAKQDILHSSNWTHKGNSLQPMRLPSILYKYVW